MTARANDLSARTQTAALWDDGDTRTDAELAAALGVTAYTVRCYHQRWNREHGQRNGRKLSAEAQVAVLEMRNNGGMTFPAIAEVLKEDFGVKASAELVRISYLRDTENGLSVAVEVPVSNLPLMTTAGLCWAGAVTPPPKSSSRLARHSNICDSCLHKPQCCEAGERGWLVRCERPLQFELMEVGQ